MQVKPFHYFNFQKYSIERKKEEECRAMSPTTRAKKIKEEEKRDEELSRINALSQRLKNLATLNEINDFAHQSDSLRRSVRLQYSIIRTIVDGICKKKKFNYNYIYFSCYF